MPLVEAFSIGGVGKMTEMAASKRRLPIRSLPSRKVRLQYLVFPYTNFQVGPLGTMGHFKLADFDIWKDEAANWQFFLKCIRPSKHLQMYVDRDGATLRSIWIASRPNGQEVDAELWRRLTSVLFYLAWARLPSIAIDRAAAEDFFAEPFALPEGAEEDSSFHVRWSKYGTTLWSETKVYPAVEVAFRSCEIDLPVVRTGFLERLNDLSTGPLFTALERELRKPSSRILTGLWFLHQASYRSFARAGYAEDIQNICSALEAILDVSERGDSATQVADGLTKVFRNLACTPAQSALAKNPDIERPAVLQRLRDWTKALYHVRNEYTHGKTVTTFSFGERSLWQDSFEIFRLTANRVILQTPERFTGPGTKLEKRLMSVAYFDEAVSFFSKKNEWIDTTKKSPTVRNELQEVIRKARALDPQLVESISNPKLLKQALFHICTKINKTLLNVDRTLLPADSTQVLAELEEAFTLCQNTEKKIDVDFYIKRVAPRLDSWVPLIPMEGPSIWLYEIGEAFKNLRFIYASCLTYQQTQRK